MKTLITRGHEWKVKRLPLKLDLPWESLEAMKARWIGCLWSNIYFEEDERHMSHCGWMHGAELRLHLKLDLPWRRRWKLGGWMQGEELRPPLKLDLPWRRFWRQMSRWKPRGWRSWRPCRKAASKVKLTLKKVMKTYESLKATRMKVLKAMQEGCVWS